MGLLPLSLDSGALAGAASKRYLVIQVSREYQTGNTEWCVAVADGLLNVVDEDEDDEDDGDDKYKEESNGW